jgi:hypothetical protein
VRQFRLSLELVTRRTRRALSERCRALRSRPVQETENRGSYATYLRRREAVQKSRAFYEAFENQFDGLVGAICFAAQEGITASAEADFAAHRTWFLEHYRSIRPYLTPFEISDESDVIPTRWGMRRCDTFEALFLPLSIKAMLDGDNGCLINRLMRAQNAATGWHDAMRYEETACGYS